MKKTYFIRLVFLVQRNIFSKFYTFQKIFSEKKLFEKKNLTGIGCN